MWFWRDSFCSSLTEIATEARNHSGWEPFGEYCSLQERGLRPQAMVVLNKFVFHLEAWPFEQRKIFVSWLLHRSDDRDGANMLKPHQLLHKIIGPTLKQWVALEPNASEPHRWLGGTAHLRRAIELNPEDMIARRLLIEHVVSFVGYSVHELPIGYLGDPDDDLADVIAAQAFAGP